MLKTVDDCYKSNQFFCKISIVHRETNANTNDRKKP